MVSTISSAGWPARSIAARISAMRLVAPVEVSLCTTITALIACALSSASFASIAAGSAPRRQSPGMKSTSMPKRPAIWRHSVAKWPVSTISTLSPGDSVLTIAASQAPVPEDGKMMTGPLGLEDLLAALEHRPAELGEFGAAVVDDRHVHGAQDALGDRARARNLQEMASLMHENLPGGGLWPASGAILHSFFVISIEIWYSIVAVDAVNRANYCAANEIHDSRHRGSDRPARHKWRRPPGRRGLAPRRDPAAAARLRRRRQHSRRRARSRAPALRDASASPARRCARR